MRRSAVRARSPVTVAHGAQRGLEQPFKHADALAAAITRQTQIAAEMQRRQQSEPQASTATDSAASAPGDAQRVAGAGFPAAPGRRPAAGPTAPPASPRPGAPDTARDNDPSR